MISVCMATFNGEEYIQEQLKSILKQLTSDDEVIISDDGSSDRTLEIISNFNDNRITIVKSEEKGNPTFNFENAIRNSSGDIIFLADQDDVWLNNKVSVMSQLITDGADLVLSNCKVVDDSLHVINNSYFSFLHNKGDLISNLLQNRFIGCCMAFRSSIRNMVIPFPVNIPAHDWWIGLVALKKGRVVFCSEPLMLYRRHGNNASSTSEKSHTPLLQRVKWRLILFLELIKIGK